MDDLKIEDYRQFADTVDRILKQGDPVPPFVDALDPKEDPEPSEYASELDAIIAASKRGLVHLI